jgi:hypothetical protein
MGPTHLRHSLTSGQDGRHVVGARLNSMAKGVAGGLDLVDVILIVGPPMVAAVMHGFSELMNNHVEPERTLLRPRRTR